MSLIGSRVNMTSTCTIERDANAGIPNNWGNQTTPNWQPHLIDVPCRAWAEAGRETVTNSTTVVVVEDARLIVPLGTDVTEQDRVASVSFRGATTMAGPLGIRAVLTHQDHIEIVLVKVA